MENTAIDGTAKPDYPCFRGVPTFIRALTYDVSTRQPGYDDYGIIGMELGRHTVDMINDAYGVEDPDERIEQLWTRINANDVKAILGWYRRNFPACMRLVPSRRRQKFVAGVLRAVEEGLVD